MQDRFVWYHALEDLQGLLPLPGPVNIGQMSVFEMRRLCVRVAQTYKRWLGRSFTPRLVCATKCGRTRATQLLPGGKHLLTVTENGSLLLHWLHHLQNRSYIDRRPQRSQSNLARSAARRRRGPRLNHKPPFWSTIKLVFVDRFLLLRTQTGICCLRPVL